MNEQKDLREAFSGRTIAVIGVGAIGGLIGGWLSRVKQDIWLIDPWTDHVKAMQHSGLRLEEPESVSVVPVNALHTSELEKIKGIDVLLVTVKSYDTARMVSLLKPYLSPGVFAVTCQNGLNADTLAELLGASATLACVPNMGAVLVGPGHVRRMTSYARLTFGELDGSGSERVRELALLFSSSAETRMSTDIKAEQWMKLTRNCIGNPLLSLTGYSVRELHVHPGAATLIRAVIAELVHVAEGCGCRLPVFGIDPEVWKTPASVPVPAIDDALAAHGRALGGLRSSMSYDLEHGRPLEIEHLNGYAVRKGESLGIPTPLNRAIVMLVRKLEQGTIRPSPQNLDGLLSLVV